MTISDCYTSPCLLLLVAGAKGAIGSTVAAAGEMIRQDPAVILPNLTTCGEFDLGPCPDIIVSGWDTRSESMSEALAAHGVLPPAMQEPVAKALDRLTVKSAPSSDVSFDRQVAQIAADILDLRAQYPQAQPVFVNLLPAGLQLAENRPNTLSDMLQTLCPARYPDLPYALASIQSEIPVVNFTPNEIEIPAVVDAAVSRGVPMAGCDGKTGQTFFKVVLASALKARGLRVDGWYSTNILGNADGENLMDPDRAAGKVANKTQLLDTLLGYPVGERYGCSAHTVRIDYYPPRGDAKEAWDVIDFTGLFGLPMSMRMNLQGRDSILAAPMVIDLARWLAALQKAGRSGLVPELGLYFKAPAGENPAVTFQDQVQALDRLRQSLRP